MFNLFGAILNKNSIHINIIITNSRFENIINFKIYSFKLQAQSSLLTCL